MAIRDARRSVFTWLPRVLAPVTTLLSSAFALLGGATGA